VRSAQAGPAGVTLGLTDSDGRARELSADHVIAATGYRPDVARLQFLDAELRMNLRSVAHTPAVDKYYQSSIPGLYFMGPGVAPTFGPVMRFVYGADHAACTVAQRLAAGAGRRPAARVRAGR
jgi:pyruvate/2-oxoglutarate dehydrogenase complex dihydrolipoamide dehydrogenase (E3) component